MNEKAASSDADAIIDQKIKTDWEAVLARLEDLNGRSDGDTRRQAILKRLGLLKRAS